MSISSAVKVVFTCDRAQPTCPSLSIEREDKSSLYGTYHECLHAARQQGWRVREQTYMCASLTLCPECNAKSLCDHGYDPSWPEHKACNGR